MSDDEIVLDQLRVDDPRAGTGKLPVVCRRHHISDVPVIFDGWLRSYRHAKAVSQIPNETYYFFHHQLLEGLWFDRTARWLVACNPESPSQVYGFIVGTQAASLAGDHLVVHYCYVRQPYRRFGLASRLLATLDTRAAPDLVVTTHQTDSGKEWLRTLGVTTLYNPYLFWGRAPVPHPELKGYDGRRARRRADPIVTSRRATTIGGYVPGGTGEEE